MMCPINDRGPRAGIGWRRLRAGGSLSLTVALVGSAGCGEGRTGDGGLVLCDASACDGGGATFDARSDSIDVDAPRDGSADSASGPDLGVGVFTELPRRTADPAFTRRLVEGRGSLVGSGISSCSHGASNERWCAFSRPSNEGGALTELWVMNVSKAIAGAQIRCEENGDDCFRLSSNLFTGSHFPGPFHPFDHRFDGDTLIFYAEVPPSTPQPYVGPVWAWRQGWRKPRQISTSNGGLCFAHARAPAAYCTDSVVSVKDPNSILGIPIYRELDLLAGSVEDPSLGPLPKVEHLVAVDAATLAWRARFTPKGEVFAYSHVPPGETHETLKVVRTVDVGRADPVTVATDASQWEIAHDGAAVYFLRGFDRSLGLSADGTLMLADLPFGLTPVKLQPAVASFELVGAREGVISDVDKGVAFYNHAPMESWTFSVMLDRSRPTDVTGLGSKPYNAQISTDARHAVYLEAPLRPGYDMAHVARTDGTGSCVLTLDRRAESYGIRFSDSGRNVFWIEYGRAEARSEEGWYARPGDCSQKTKYGDYVTQYRLVGDDFVVFDGGDSEDQTSWLQYTPLANDDGGAASSPTIITEHPDTVAIIVSGGEAFVVYTRLTDVPSEAGVYLFGPLRRSP